MGFARLRVMGAWLALCLGVAFPARAEDVIVFAAASLKTALEEINQSYEEAGHDPVVLSFAGSAALARQIQLGAPASLFISANEAWMEVLDESGLIVPETRHDLLRNQLVLVGQKDQAPVQIGPDMNLPHRLGQGYLAMALVQAVPAGIYGRQALQTYGQWGPVAAQVAQADNVRAALAIVASGEAPMGIVYASDAIAEPRVKVLGRFPETAHDPIIYPAAIIAGYDTIGARDFLSYLRGPKAQAIFRAQGFLGADKS